jgi:hypothetical protein
MLGGVGPGPNVHALLGIPVPTYTGGALAPAGGRPTTSEERLAGLRRLDAQAVCSHLSDWSFADVERLSDEATGALRALDGERQAAGQLSGDLRTHTLGMIDAHEAQVRAIQALMAAVMDAHTGQGGTADAELLLQWRVGQKNVAEALHEVSCLAAACAQARADDMPARLAAQLDEACSLALCNLATQVHVAQQEALTRTRTAIDEAFQSDRLGLKPQTPPSGARGLATVMGHLRANTPKMIRALDLLQIQHVCGDLLSCYSSTAAELGAFGYAADRGARPLADRDGAAGRLPGWLTDRPAGVLEQMQMLSACRRAFMEHASTIHRGYLWVQTEIAFGEPAEGPLLQHVHVLTQVGANLLAGYAMALDAASELRENVLEGPPAEMLALADESLLARIDQIARDGQAMQAAAGARLDGADRQLWGELTAAAADMQARAAAWRTAPSDVYTFAAGIAMFAPVAATVAVPAGQAASDQRLETGRTQAASVLDQPGPLLAPLPEPPAY